MKILTSGQYKKLVRLLTANQIIMNNYNNGTGFEQIQLYGQFTDNTSDALFILGGAELSESVKNYVFRKDH